METKLKGEMLICPFENYPSEKKKLLDKFPDGKVIEEIKQLYVQQLDEIKGIKMSGQSMLMIIYAVVLEVKADVQTPIKLVKP